MWDGVSVSTDIVNCLRNLTNYKTWVPGAGWRVSSRGWLSLPGSLETGLSSQLLVEVPTNISDQCRSEFLIISHLALCRAGLAVLELSKGESGGNGDLGGATAGITSTGAGRILTGSSSSSWESVSSWGFSSISLWKELRSNFRHYKTIKYNYISILW